MYRQDEQRSIEIFHQDLRKIEKLPLSERKENSEALRDTLLNHRTHFLHPVDWLLAGHFGHGPYIKAWEAIDNKRMNRRAYLFQTVACLNFNVPQREANKLWNSLTPEVKEQINAGIQNVMDWHLEEKAKESTQEKKG